MNKILSKLTIQELETLYQDVTAELNRRHVQTLKEYQEKKDDRRLERHLAISR